MIHIELRERDYIDAKFSGHPLDVLCELKLITAAILDEYFGEDSDRVLDMWPLMVRDARKHSTRVSGSLLELLDNKQLGGDKNERL